MSTQLTVYEPNQRQKIGFLRSWIVMITNIVQSRELIAQLFKRDFFAVYKKSFFGVAWVLLIPLLGILPMIFMNAANILNPGVVGVPYTVFVLLSMTVWQLFAGILTLSSQTLSSGAGFIMQVKFPHEALLIKQSAQQLATSLLAFVLCFVVLLVFRVMPDWRSIFVPFMVLPIFFLGAGLGLLLSVLGIVIADISRALVYVLQAAMYITPIVYSAKVSNPALQMVIDYNPLTYLVGDVRDVILHGTIAHPDRYAWASLFAVGVFMLAWRLFFLSEERVIEKMI